MTRRLFTLSCIIATGLLSLPVSAHLPPSGTGITVAGASAVVSLYAPTEFTAFEHIREGSVEFEGSGSSRTMRWALELPAPGGVLNPPQRTYLVWITRPGSSSFSGGTFSYYQYAGVTLDNKEGFVQAVVGGPAGVVSAEHSTANGITSSTASNSETVVPGETKIHVLGYHSLYLHVEP